MKRGIFLIFIVILLISFVNAEVLVNIKTYADDNFSDQKTEECIAVDLATLDEGFGKDTIFWKLDVEGYEQEVLFGGKRSLESRSLKMILIETVSVRSKELLLRNGFERIGYDALERTIIPYEKSRMNNELWVRDIALIRKRIATSENYEFYGVKF